MRETTLKWYPHYLNHPGGERLDSTIKENFHWKGPSNQAKKYSKTCKVYQQHKKHQKYGHLPAKIIKDILPWRTVNKFFIGPYTITAK